MRFLELALDTTLERRPDELIGAILIATALSIASAGLYRLVRRKRNDSTMLMALLMVPATCLGMAIAAGHVARTRAAVPGRFVLRPDSTGLGPRQVGPAGQRKHAAWNPSVKDAAPQPSENADFPPR